MHGNEKFLLIKLHHQCKNYNYRAVHNLIRMICKKDLRVGTGSIFYAIPKKSYLIPCALIRAWAAIQVIRVRSNPTRYSTSASVITSLTFVSTVSTIESAIFDICSGAILFHVKQICMYVNCTKHVFNIIIPFLGISYMNKFYIKVCSTFLYNTICQFFGFVCCYVNSA